MPPSGLLLMLFPPPGNLCPRSPSTPNSSPLLSNTHTHHPPLSSKTLPQESFPNTTPHQTRSSPPLEAYGALPTSINHCILLLEIFDYLFGCSGSLLQHAGFSPAVVHRLSCPVACGMLVPWSEIEPTFPYIGRHQGSPVNHHALKNNSIISCIGLVRESFLAHSI